MKIKQGVLEIQSIENFQNILQNKEFRQDENDANDAYENGKLIRQGWVTFRTIVPGFNHRIQQNFVSIKTKQKKLFWTKFFSWFLLVWFVNLIASEKLSNLAI